MKLIGLNGMLSVVKLLLPCYDAETAGEEFISEIDPSLRAASRGSDCNWSLCYRDIAVDE